MLLLLLANFVTGFGLKLIYIYIYIYHIYIYISSSSSSSSSQISRKVPLISNLPNLMESLDSPVIVAKGLLKLPNLYMVIKEKSPSLSTNLAVRRTSVSVLNKDNSAIPPLLNGPEVLPSLFAEKFSEKFNLDESVISLPVFDSRTNLKLHNYALTSVIVKKVITNLDLSKTSGPDCISVVVLKNYGPEISYMLAELFNECLRQSCFPVLKGITDGPCI